MQIGKRLAAAVIVVLLFGSGIGAVETKAQIGGFLKKKAKNIVQPDSDKNTATF